MKILDYEGLKQVVGKIKGLIDKKADKVDLEKFKEGSKFLDTRERNENPEFYIKNYPQNIVREFKRTSVMGLSEKLKDAFCYVITVFGWANLSGGNPCQYSISSNGANIYYRVGIDNTKWSSWTRVLDDTDLKTNLSQFNSDPNNRLVTDTEKSTWNSKLSTVSGQDISRSKAKGYNTSSTWQSLSSTRDLEDWIGDFDKRTRENKDSISSVSNQIVSEYRVKQIVSDNTMSRYEVTQIVEQNGVNESKVRDIAKEIAYAGVIQSYDSNVGNKLNSIFGTSFWNVNSINDLVSGDSAISELLNNRAAFAAMLNVNRFLNVASRSITFTDSLIGNDSAFEVFVNSITALKATYASSEILSRKISGHNQRNAQLREAYRNYGIARQ